MELRIEKYLSYLGKAGISRLNEKMIDELITDLWEVTSVISDATDGGVKTDYLCALQAT